MPIITISRGSYSRGKEVAEKLAQALNYEVISRGLILEASEKFNIPEIKMVRAVHDAPSILDRFTFGKEIYIAFFRSILLKHVQKDNVVYHGLGGHFFLKGIPHVLKVRIQADIEDRVMAEMKREGISAEKARFILKKDDDERRKWSLSLYGVDTSDPNLYDVVLSIKKLTVDDAVDILLHAAKLPCFQATPESKKILDDMVLASQAEVSLVKKYPNVAVSSKDGDIFVNVKTSIDSESEIIGDIQAVVGKLEGVKDIKVSVMPLRG
ncbi:MAG: cytidylate kinase-like family protein [Deltaproteobacteria bacterium]|nr:cytidylate kinase-like family protein [Deltaproteobacteria bacterium]